MCACVQAWGVSMYTKHVHVCLWLCVYVYEVLVCAHTGHVYMERGVVTRGEPSWQQPQMWPWRDLLLGFLGPDSHHLCHHGMPLPAAHPSLSLVRMTETFEFREFPA